MIFLSAKLYKHYCILDDLNTENMAMATSMLGFEGAIKGTKKDGPTKQVTLYNIM